MNSLFPLFFLNLFIVNSKSTLCDCKQIFMNSEHVSCTCFHGCLHSSSNVKPFSGLCSRLPGHLLATVLTPNSIMHLLLAGHTKFPSCNRVHNEAEIRFGAYFHDIVCTHFATHCKYKRQKQCVEYHINFELFQNIDLNVDMNHCHQMS